MFSKWSDVFDTAVSFYVDAVYRADLSIFRREAAARSLLGVIEQYNQGGDIARAQLRSALTDHDAFRRNTAARILVSLPDPAAAADLLAAYLNHSAPQLDPGNLGRVGKTSPPNDEWWNDFDSLRLWERAPFVRALLRRPTEEARRRAILLISGVDDLLAQEAIASLARWGRYDLLRPLLSRPPAPSPPGLPPELRIEDVRVDAAFQMALGGDRQGVEFLLSITSEKAMPDSPRAALRLAWLAWPGAVEPVAKLLRSRKADTAALALEAAGALRSPALGAALLHLAGRKPSFMVDPPPLADQGLQTLEDLTGKSVLGEFEQGASDGRLTADARQLGVASQRAALAALDPALRYRRGEPLLLSHLTENLTSVHTFTASAAACNLRAITGEDHGFEIEDDLIANLSAIHAWRLRASLDQPGGPGGWAFAGTPIPGPTAVAG